MPAEIPALARADRVGGENDPAELSRSTF